MNAIGIIVGAATFLIIGICHPLVIWGEYKWGLKFWWVFLIVGLMLSAISLICPNNLLSTIIGAGAFSCFWGILEMFEQEKRVLKGWFPENPKRHSYYQAKREENRKA